MQSTLQASQNAFSGMNLLDWLIALTLAISTVTAFMRGFIRSLFALAGTLLGIMLATLYAPRLAKDLVRWVTTPALARLCAFILILACVYITATLLARLLRRLSSAAGLGFFDRMAGAAFGLVRGALFLSALLFPLAPYLPQFEVARSSLLLPYLLSAAHGISFVMPRDVREHTPASTWRIRRGQLAGEILPDKRPTAIKLR